MKRFNKYTGRIQQVFGVIMLLSAMLIYTNYDKIIQTRILDAFPAYSQLVSGWEQGDKVSHALSQLRQTRPQVEMAEGKPSQLPDLGPAAELTGISHWLNTSSPVSIASLKGKVILVDFWTYSCINCIRTLPHVTGWYEKYKDQGLVVIGVHTPEFAFEKKSANVALAIKQFGIHYPVAQDNDFRTWQAYQNQYWPAQYLIDARGRLRKTHFGEGEYDKMEQAIQALLQEAGQNITGKINQNTNKTSYHSRTPETYLGLARLERFASPEKPQSGLQRFTRPEKIKKDYFAYEGEWELLDEAAHPLKGAVLSLRFTGNKVFLVIGPQETSHNSLSVKLDGVIIPNELAGGDVHNGLVSLDTERLYELVALKGDSNSHLLQLEFNDASLKLYAFTFG